MVKDPSIQSIKSNGTVLRNNKKRVYIGGAPIDPLSAQEAAVWALGRLKAGLRTTVVPVNAAVVVHASSEPSYRQTLDGFDLALADGLWPALGAMFLLRSRVPHTNTSPFMKAIFHESSPDGLRVFLMGARPEIVKRAAANLPHIHRNAVVVGYISGYFKPPDEVSIIDIINRSRPDILLLGISSPKKELFIQKHWGELTLPISVGVGGLFDVWAGEVREAPNWIRRCGFEWLFRLCMEPRRLWKRYTIINLRFIVVIIKQALALVFHIRGGRPFKDLADFNGAQNEQLKASQIETQVEEKNGK